jgi:hypothetical protein
MHAVEKSKRIDCALWVFFFKNIGLKLLGEIYALHGTLSFRIRRYLADIIKFSV